MHLLKKLLLYTTVILIAVNGYTQTGCPRGYVLNCKGMCGLYKPNNKYGYCQYSVLSDDIKNLIYGVKDTVSVKKESEDKNKKDSLKTENGKDEKILKNDNPSNNKIALKEKVSPPSYHEKEITASDSIKKTTIINDTSSLKNIKVQIPQNFNQPYDIISIFGIALVLYIFTYVLARKKVLKKCNHKKVWNIILLITFLVTGLLGLFMVIQLNYNLQISWFRSLLFWHVEFGIAMAAISIFHILWHIKYFMNLFKKDKHCHNK